MHLSDETLDAYMLGRLSETEAAKVDNHLRECPDCRDRLSESNAFRAIERAVRRGE